MTGEGVASFLRWAMFCATRVEVLVQGSILASAVECTILYNTVQYYIVSYSFQPNIDPCLVGVRTAS